jgi:Flp pilus assembly protein TadD
MIAALRVRAAWPFAILLLLSSALEAQESRGPGVAPDATSLNAEALRLVEARKIDEAFLVIEQARKLLPKDPTIATNFARILTRRAQAAFERSEFDSAAADLERALEAAQKESLTRVQLAIVWRSVGDLPAARREIHRTLESDPSCSQAFEELARIAYEDEDLDAASEALATALKLDPSREKALAEFKDKVEREKKVESGWYRSERGAFVVKYDDQTFKDVGETVLGFLDAAESIARQTLAHVPARRVTVVLYSHADFTNTTGAHPWAGGLFDGKIRLPVKNFRLTRDAIRRTIAHEYMHLVVRDLTRKCPTWLNEGLAQLAEGKPLQHAREILRGQSEPRAFSSLPAAWMGITDAKAVAEMYAQSLLFTDYLVRRVGYHGVKDLLQKSAGAAGFHAAFVDVVGKPLDDSEAEWRGPK